MQNIEKNLDDIHAQILLAAKACGRDPDSILLLAVSKKKPASDIRVAFAHGQKATEQFIPIGQSPGLSYKVTHLGKITNVNARVRSITVAGSAGTSTVKITERTQIWLDYTKRKMTNQTGNFADLRRGRTVEVKYIDPQRKAVADWIKVEMARPNN